jgi:hypothetical protein
VPCVYTSPALFLATHPVQLGAPLACGIAAAGLLCVWVRSLTLVHPLARACWFQRGLVERVQAHWNQGFAFKHVVWNVNPQHLRPHRPGRRPLLPARLSAHRAELGVSISENPRPQRQMPTRKPCTYSPPPVQVNYDSDRQRQTFRATHGAAPVWGRPAKFITAKFTTSTGQSKSSLLLYSGWCAAFTPKLSSPYAACLSTPPT